MADAPSSEADIAVPHRGRGRPKTEAIALTKAARARFDTLAAGSIDVVFQAVLTAATQDGDMAAAKLIIDRVIPSRRGAPVSFHIRPLKTPEDCALAYTDLLDDVGSGRLTPEEAQTISAIVAKRAELFASVELATEIEALKRGRVLCFSSLPHCYRSALDGKYRVRSPAIVRRRGISLAGQPKGLRRNGGLVLRLCA